jgi:hypothetical protein
MTPAEVAITAALGASFLTAAGSLGVVWVQALRSGKAQDRAALRAAVRELLSRSIAVALRAQTMGETMKLRSGLSEGLDVTLHLRKPADMMEFHDWMAQDLVPMHAALDEIWTRWDQDGVRLANDIVGKCMDLLGTSTATQPARTGRERIRKWVVGERWTTEMRDAHQAAIEELAHARKRFADYARVQLGLSAVDLFAQVGQPGEHAPATLASRNGARAAATITSSPGGG